MAHFTNREVVLDSITPEAFVRALRRLGYDMQLQFLSGLLDRVLLGRNTLTFHWRFDLPPESASL